MTLDPRALGLSSDDLAALGYSTPSGSTEGAGGTDEAPFDGNGALPPGGRSDARYSGVRGGRWRWLGTLVVAGALCWGVSPRRGMPAPRAANAPDASFSSGRALALLSDLGRRRSIRGCVA
jgi:hypothetical protein